MKKTLHSVIPFTFDQKAFKSETEEGLDFGYFEGYGAYFNNIDHGEDMIVKGAFMKSLQTNRKIKMFWQHNAWDIIGSFVETREDENGLYCKGRINLGTEKGKEAYALLKAGDLDGLSIGYRVLDSETNEKNVRVLKELDLYEVSLVTFPMNPKAQVSSVKSVKDELEAAETLADIEAVLKLRGFTKKETRAIVSKIKKFSGQCDAGDKVEKQEPQRDVDGDAAADLVKQINAITSTLQR
jgi:HK97 family phage prohead protease